MKKVGVIIGNMETKKVRLKVCPECYSHTFKYDEYHQELYCFNCGLILNAPPNRDFITPDLKTLTITITIHEVIIE